jgi:hypothetical protein
MGSKAREACALAVILLMTFATTAHAYTDPGTGTLIWQMLLAASFSFMFYARRLLAWVRGRRNRKDTTATPEPLQREAEDTPSEAVKH